MEKKILNQQRELELKESQIKSQEKMINRKQKEFDYLKQKLEFYDQTEHLIDTNNDEIVYICLLL